MQLNTGFLILVMNFTRDYKYFTKIARSACEAPQIIFGTKLL